MDVGHEGLIGVVQRPQEGWLLAVPAINADPFEPHPPDTRLTHDIQCMFTFRRQLARSLRDPGLVASRRVLDPALRQVKPHVHRHMPLAVRQHAEHGLLAVIDLPQTPRPLPRYANRTIALLGEAALVNDQAARRLATQQAVRILTDLCHHRFMVPWRVADEVLELLRAAAFNHGGHRRERTLLGLRQPVQIAPGHRRAVPRASLKEPAVAAAQGDKCVGDAIHQRSGQRSSAHTVTPRSASVISLPQSLNVCGDPLIRHTIPVSSANFRHSSIPSRPSLRTKQTAM